MTFQKPELWHYRFSGNETEDPNYGAIPYGGRIPVLKDPP